MKRRTMMRKLGAAGIGAAAISGSATAKRPSVDDLGIDRDIDVSSVEGAVTLDELLEPADVDSLADDVDPSAYKLTVAPDAEVLAIGDCCAQCCEHMRFADCVCHCCFCDIHAC